MNSSILLLTKYSENFSHNWLGPYRVSAYDSFHDDFAIVIHTKLEFYTHICIDRFSGLVLSWQFQISSFDCFC